MILAITVFGLAVLLGGTDAVSQDSSAANCRDMLANADANGDGDIAWTEVIDMRTRIFARLDNNQDGFIDQSDEPALFFRDRFREALGNLTQRFDENMDKRISKTELIEGPSPAFQFGDTNRDNILSAGELSRIQDLSVSPND